MTSTITQDQTDADAAAYAAARKSFWANVNPAGCLARMIEVTE